MKPFSEKGRKFFFAVHRNSSAIAKAPAEAVILSRAEWSYYGTEMKPNPAPYVPGQTEAERMDNAVRKMFSVSKEDMLKAEQQLKHDHQRKKKRAKKAH